MRISIRQLEAFRAVMISGSMTGASAILNISQPAISRMIALAEQSLDLRLFDRRRGRLVPTREADLLFAEVSKLHNLALEVNRFADDLSKNPTGVLSICASPSLALNFVPSVISRFRQERPEVRLNYRTALLADVPRELFSYQADLGITVLPIKDQNIEAIALAEGVMVAVLPKGHPLEDRDKLDLQELAAFPLIAYDRSIPFGKLIWKEFAAQGLSPNVAVEIPRAELALTLVREGVGYALLDEFAVSSLSREILTIRPLKQRIPVSINLLRFRHRRTNANVEAFTSLLLEAFETATSLLPNSKDL